MSSKMWDERYAAPGFAYGSEPNDWLKAQAPLRFKPGSKVLCLAEGEGRNAVYLAGLGLQVSGVDQSAVGLGKAARLAAERGVSVEGVVCDLADFDLGESRWDGIVSIWCHLPAALRRDLHRRAVKALKPGGVLILEAYTPDQIPLGTGGPKDPDMLASLEALKGELQGLQWLEAKEVKRDVQEGALHSGPSAVVQVAARKA